MRYYCANVACVEKLRWVSSSFTRKIIMEEPLTEEFLNQLINSDNPEEIIDSLPTGFRSLSDYLQKLLMDKGLKRSDVIRDAGLNNTFGYQIFMGQRRASRNKILQLAFAMQLSLQETNHLLQAAGVNELYVKNRRDAIIIYSISKAYSLRRVDEELYRFGEETIC